MARKLLGLLAIFIAFYMGAHYYIRWKNTVYDDVTKIGRLVECQPTDLRALELHILQPDGTALSRKFERVDAPVAGTPAVTELAQWKWKTTIPKVGEAETAILRRIASTICELYDPIPMKAVEAVPAKSKDPQADWLEAKLVTAGKPRIVKFAFVQLNSDRTTTVHSFSDGQERYVRIPDQLQKLCSLPSEAYENRRVMHLESDNVQSTGLFVDGKERFTLERAGSDWKVLLGGKEKGSASDEAEKFVNRMTTLRAIGVEAESFSPADCAGLKAKAELKVRDVVGKEEALRFAWGNKGDVSACSSLGTQKLRVHRDAVPFIDVALKAVVKGR